MQNDHIEIITLDEKNIDREHICCALADKKSGIGVNLKKEWLKDRFADGLKFKKGNVRGKVFIEYLPAETAWSPIDAPGYMFINCLWVAGRYKGMGLGSRLLEECIADSSDKYGIVILASQSKRPYLSDKKFLLSKGFEVCDTAPPYFELMVKRFDGDAPLPKFKECAKLACLDENDLEMTDGLSVFYTNQCPFTELYVNELAEAAKEYGISFRAKKTVTRDEAQRSFSPFVTYSAFYKGQFLTHEILTAEKMKKLLGHAEVGHG